MLTGPIGIVFFIKADGPSGLNRIPLNTPNLLFETKGFAWLG